MSNINFFEFKPDPQAQIRKSLELDDMWKEASPMCRLAFLRSLKVFVVIHHKDLPTYFHLFRSGWKEAINVFKEHK